MSSPIPASITPADVVQRIESSGQLDAVRFESGIFNGSFDVHVLANIKKFNNCSDMTSKAIYSMSFGLFQIMGFNLYDSNICGYTGTLGPYLTDVVIQKTSLNKFFNAKHLDYTVQQLADDQMARWHFATIYNGPGATQAYEQKIVTALNELGVKGVTHG